MRELQKQPIGLPLELQHADRRELDLLVFELLGVTDAAERERLVDQLYTASTRYYREQRIQDIQSSINRTKSKGGKSASHTALAQDAWEELEAHWRQPLSDWLAAQSRSTKTLELLEGEPQLPDASNFFEATTVYFGKKGKAHLVCDSRAEAELLYTIAQTGQRGVIAVPVAETDCQHLLDSLKVRLDNGEKRLEELSEMRAGTDKMREQMMVVLRRWFIQGKPEQ